MANIVGKSESTTENRVKTNGEVFTPDSTVNEMLDETDRKLAEYFGVSCVDNISDEDYISYIVLEPTCGSGNFIVRELDRKLKRVANYSGVEQEIALLKAVSSIHGVDITSENVVLAKLRMMEVIETGSTGIFELEYKTKQGFSTQGFKLRDELKRCIQYILDRNIQCGNSLKNEKILTIKSDYIKSIWNLQQDRVNDGIIRNSSETEELRLTQYDFENGQVALRERAYSNLTEEVERYRNTTEYVDYGKIYTLPEVNVYFIESNDDEDEDWDF